MTKEESIEFLNKCMKKLGNTPKKEINRFKELYKTHCSSTDEKENK